MTKRDERLIEVKERWAQDREYPDDVLWLITEFEKEIERGRKLYEYLDEINCMDDPAHPFQHLEISAKALEEYDKSLEEKS